MRRFLKWAGIILIVLIGIMMAYATLGMKETVNLEIKAVDLAQIPDGVYNGSYENYRWSNSVEVTVKDHRITSIRPLKIQYGGDKIVTKLTETILSQNTNDVDAITGGTASSNGFLKAVENALEGALTKQ